MTLFPRVVPFLLVPLVLALGACSSAKPTFQDDQLFSSTGSSPFSHNFEFASNDSCEAARRALLSQGYMTTMTKNDTVDGTKNFQPAVDSHIVVEIHVVCTPGDTANTSSVYVNAVQNGYALKKSDTSASVGLSILGSVSLPIRSNSDSMVKISSETIQSSAFYDRFFDLIGRYLRTVARSDAVPNSTTGIKVTLLPPVITPAPAVVSTTGGMAAPVTTAQAPASSAAPASVPAPVATAAVPAVGAPANVLTPVVNPASSTSAALPIPATPAPAAALPVAASSAQAASAPAAASATPAVVHPGADGAATATHAAADVATTVATAAGSNGAAANATPAAPAP